MINHNRKLKDQYIQINFYVDLIQKGRPMLKNNFTKQFLKGMQNNIYDRTHRFRT